MKPTKIFGVPYVEWNAMSFYGRFEQIVTWILTLFIAVIIAIALFRLVLTIFKLLVLGALNPSDHEEFEIIFGTIMTLLIAMESNHSILKAMERLHRVTQVKTEHKAAKIPNRKLLTSLPMRPGRPNSITC